MPRTERAECLLGNNIRPMHNNEYLTLGNKCFVGFVVGFYVLHLSPPAIWPFCRQLLLAQQELPIGFILFHCVVSWLKTCVFLSLKVCPDKEPGLQPWVPGHSQEHRVTIGYGKKVLLTTSATVHSIEILNGGTFDKYVLKSPDCPLISACSRQVSFLKDNIVQKLNHIFCFIFHIEKFTNC